MVIAGDVPVEALKTARAVFVPATTFMVVFVMPLEPPPLMLTSPPTGLPLPETKSACWPDAAVTDSCP